MILSRVMFIVLSFALRIIEALGAAAAVVSGFSLIGSMFPKNVATVFVSAYAYPKIRLYTYTYIGYILQYPSIYSFHSIFRLPSKRFTDLDTLLDQHWEEFCST